MSPFVFVIPVVLIIGAIASSRGSVAQGDDENTPNVPVPFKPKNNDGETGWRYRGLYVAVHELDDGSFDWHVHPTVDFNSQPLAEGSWSDQAGSLLGATQWIDNFRGGPLA